MKGLKIYTILTYILLPIACLFGITSIVGLLIALANPTMLIPLFIMVCMVIYIFSSFSFLRKGIQQNKPCKKILKDLLKINGVVSVIFSVNMLLSGIQILYKKEILNSLVEDFVSQQKGLPVGMKTTMLNIMQGSIYFMIGVGICVLIHVALNFRLMKDYQHVFLKDEEN